VHVVAIEVDLRIPGARSLKDKRHVVRSLLDGARHRFAVSAAEVGDQDVWQRAKLGFAAVGSSARQAEDVIDAVDRWVWSNPEVEVVEVAQRWLDDA
jgi:uncharacterized protein YlxP (DUF503 family)